MEKADLQTVNIMDKVLNLKQGEYMSSEDLPAIGNIRN